MRSLKKENAQQEHTQQIKITIVSAPRLKCAAHTKDYTRTNTPVYTVRVRTVAVVTASLCASSALKFQRKCVVKRQDVQTASS